ncbi:hypothetical protein LINGRAHAP2_LOCUS7454, partial [Linum grandiflorum]
FFNLLPPLLHSPTATAAAVATGWLPPISRLSRFVRRRRRQRKQPPLSALSLILRWMKTDNTRRSSSPARWSDDELSLFGFSVRGHRIVLALMVEGC